MYWDWLEVGVYEFTVGATQTDSFDKRQLRQLMLLSVLLKSVANYEGWHLKEVE